MKKLAYIDGIVSPEETLVGGSNLLPIDLVSADSARISCDIAVDVVDDQAFLEADVDPVEDTFTITDHGFRTGLAVQLTTSGTLPDPLLVLTDYFIIKIDDDTFKLALSYADAIAGTHIDLIDDGTDGGSVDPEAISGASVKLQKSDDLINWADISSPASQNITTSAVLYFELTSIPFRYVRVVYTIGNGQITQNVYALVKGYV